MWRHHQGFRLLWGHHQGFRLLWGGHHYGFSDEDHDVRRPAEVKDERFQRAKQKRIIKCDTRGRWWQGNGTGSFLCPPVDSSGVPIVVDQREDAWKSGRWNATWNCVECAGMLPAHLCQRMVKKVSYCYQHGFGHRPQACWGMVGGAVNMDR